MWQSGWEGSCGENGYMYMYGWVPLLFTWSYHNTVNRLYPSTKLKNKQTNKQTKTTIGGEKGFGGGVETVHISSLESWYSLKGFQVIHWEPLCYGLKYRQHALWIIYWAHLRHTEWIFKICANIRKRGYSVVHMVYSPCFSHLPKYTLPDFS